MEFVVWLCDKLADVVSAAENYENYERRFLSKVMLIAVDGWNSLKFNQKLPPAILVEIVPSHEWHNSIQFNSIW